MNIEKPTFKHICLMHMQQLTNFPYIEKDFDAVTDYQLLCKVVEYLNEVITNNNTQNESITNLYNAFIELKDYIDNYFTNLDVQDEIDNKLNRMAEDGTLTSIIESYILPYETGINEQISIMNNKINQVVSGSPLAASSTAEMTDTTRIYVNTTNGYWYYYDGDSWEQGGVYQSELNPEVEDIRTAYNGTIFSSAGDSVRNQVSDIHTTLNKAFDFDRNYTEYTSADASVDVGNYYTQSSGNIITNASYLSISKQVTSRSYVYATSSVTNKTITIYNDSTFGTDSFVERHTHSSGEFPTIDNPLEVQAGNYVVVTSNSVNATLKIYESDSYDIELKDIPINKYYNALTDITMRENTYINNYGIYTPDTEYAPMSSDMFPLFKGDKLKWHMQTSTSAGAYWFRIAFYDANKHFISQITNNSAASVSGDVKYTNIDIDVNVDGCCYGAISFRTYNDDALLYTLRCLVNYDSLNKRIIANQNLENKFNLSVSYPFDNLYPLSIAHRGDEASAPENTLPAFRLAKQKGWDFIECDIRLTSDGVPVLLHDPTINRTARNADGTTISETINIADITYEQALTYSFGYYKDAKYADVKICTVEEVLELAKEIGLYIIFDCGNGRVESSNKFEDIYKLIKEYDMLDRVGFVAPSVGYIKPFLDYYPKFFMLMDNQSSYDTLGQVPPAVNLKTPYNRVCFEPDTTHLTTNTIINALNNGLEVGTWLLTTKESMLNLPQQVSSVTSTNYPYKPTLYEGNIGDDDGLLD